MKGIEIPFGAKDSELKGWEYTIPEGMEAEIKDGKIVVREKESEDEMIRKRLINLIKELATSKVPILTGGYFVDGQDKKYIAWLEKQKEQKFTHHETGESLQSAVTRQMEDDGDVDDFVRRGIDDIALRYAELGANWQKEQKPAEWSEEDERMMNGIRLVLESWDRAHSSIAGLPSLIPGYIDWLKSLRPQGSKDSLQTHWKPSEEQMDALCYALQVMNTDLSPIAAKSYQGLQEIQQNLRKLM